MSYGKIIKIEDIETTEEMDRVFEEIVRLRTERYKAIMISRNLEIHKIRNNLQKAYHDNNVLRFFLAMSLTYSIITSIVWLS